MDDPVYIQPLIEADDKKLDMLVKRLLSGNLRPLIEVFARRGPPPTFDELVEITGLSHQRIWGCVRLVTSIVRKELSDSSVRLWIKKDGRYLVPEKVLEQIRRSLM
jgi:hypothetical protein